MSLQSDPSEASPANLELASIVYVNHVGSGTRSFTFKDAMLSVGIDQSLAENEFFHRKLEEYVYRGSSSRFVLPMDRESKHERFKALANILFFVGDPPNDFNARVMRMAGFKDHEVAPGSDCQKCHRYKKKLTKMKEKNERPTIPPFQRPQPQVVPIGVNPIPEHVVTMDPDEDTGQETVSPLSALSTKKGRHAMFEPPLNAPTLWKRRKNSKPKQPKASPPSSMASTTSSSRMTSKQKQMDRKRTTRCRHEGRMILKFASAWWEQKNSPSGFLDSPKSAEETAAFFNMAFDVEIVTAAFLERSLENKTCDQLPPLQDGKISAEDFQNLCDLCWSCEAIEQSNVSVDRLNRVQMKNMVEKIVNGKIADDNEGVPENQRRKPMNIESLWERVETENSLAQDVTKVDPRVQRRVEWCTFKNQTKHYESSEEALVNGGYADYPKDDAERAQKGYVVYREGQTGRYLNVDEVKISLDEEAEEAGGRPSMTHTTDQVHEGGRADQSNDTGLTLLLGCTGNNEPLPPFVIYPTAAANGCGRINIKTLDTFHQIEAQYAYSKVYPFECEFSTAPKGSMTKVLMPLYWEKMREWFPDAQDRDGYRVFLKLDTGPGRTASKFLAQSRVDGFDIFPGLPNGTEMGQEMDQLFSHFKQICYQNRAVLVKKHGKITMEDVGTMIFGGVVRSNDPNDDGEDIVLPNAFEEGFTAEKIQRAREKCGYCPATRNALNHPKIRSEIPIRAGTSGDNEEESNVDPMIQKLLSFEKINHDAVEYLEKAGYRHAIEGKRNAMRVRETNVNFGRNVTTIPNTPERVEALKKARYAGQFYQILDGGGVINTADMLRAKNDKYKEKRAEEEKKRKKDIEAFAGIIVQAKKISEIPYKRWKKKEFEVATKYKLGPKEAFKRGNGTSQLKLKKLKDTYEAQYKGKRKTWTLERWTNADETELARLQSKEMSPMEELEIYGEGVERQNELLVTSLKSVSKERFASILQALYSQVDEERRSIMTNPAGNEDQVVGENDSNVNDSFSSSSSSEMDHPNDDDDDNECDDDNDDDDFTLIELEGTTNTTENEPTSSGTATATPTSITIPVDCIVYSDSSHAPENISPEVACASRRDDVSDSSSDAPSFHSENCDGDDLLSSDGGAIQLRIEELSNILRKFDRAEELENQLLRREDLEVDDFKFLISSRGGTLGQAKTVRGLRAKWKKVEKNPLVWPEDKDELEKELVALVNKRDGR